MNFEFRILIILVFGFLLKNCASPQGEYLAIAAAANMQFAIAELTQNFSKSSGLSCQTIISSSGKLTAQIKEGAPFDIFVSADMKYPEELHNNGFTTSAPKIYAYGRLVLWTTDESITPNVSVLLDDKVKHIAIANPKTAPYGQAAIEVLEQYQHLTQVENKLVYGESIAQTNQFIISQAAQIGFTAKSVVLSPNIKNQGQWIEIPTKLYSPIAQGVVILKKTKQQKSAQLFYDFLFSERGQKILEKYGYSTI